MSQALREGHDALTGDGKEPLPVVVRKEAPPYDPTAAAYAPERGPSPLDELVSSVKEGACIELQLACKDGRREALRLNETESKAWITGTLEDRITFANRKICERRVQVALSAAHRLIERHQQPSAQTLTPEEEACLREFGAIEDVQEPLTDGGYRKAQRLTESFARAGGATTLDAATAMVLREDFWDGGSWGGAAATYTPAPTQREYLPQGGPAMEQMLISDVWQELAKTRFAWRHDPIAKHACELTADFVLGRGVSVNCQDDAVQAIVDEFMDREAIPEKLHQWTVALSRDGDIYLRKFSLGDGRLKVRKLHAATIWEIVTDAEDPLEVFWYVQRFQTRTVLYAQNVPAAATRWIERTIPASDVLHVKINADESDVRGISDLYPALGWMKRLRDYFDAVVQKEYAAAAYQWHYKVTGGGQSDIDRIAAAAAQVPQPGSSFTTNDKVDVQAVSADTKQAVGNGSTYEALVNHAALSCGLTKEYFGAASHMARASALIATEPAAKTFERRQDVMSAALEQLIDDVIAEAVRCGKLPANANLEFQVVFPSIIKADASARITLLKLGEAMGWISKETAANQYAEEADLDDYDFDDEMSKIQQEIGIDPRGLIARDAGMIKKGLPSADDAAFDPGEVPNPGFGGTPDSHNASPTSATGAAAIRNEQGRGGVQDTSTMEFEPGSAIDQALQEARRRNGIVIVP